MRQTRIFGCTVLAVLLAGCAAREPDTPLAAAALRDDVAEVRALLAAGADPDEIGASGESPLIFAAREGRLAAVQVLIEGGADVNLRDGAGTSWPPLVHAIHKGRSAVARRLLEAGAAVDAKSSGGATPLMYAAAYGDTAIVRLLLERGADARAETSGGVTALWNTVGGGALFDFTDGPPFGSCFPDTVDALLESAPDLTLRRFPSGWLIRAFATEECSELIARLGA